MRPSSTRALFGWASCYGIPAKTTIDRLCEIAEQAVAAQTRGELATPQALQAIARLEAEENGP
jgi:hypothetical protein